MLFVAVWLGCEPRDRLETADLAGRAVAAVGWFLLLGKPGAAGWQGVVSQIGWWVMLVAVILTVLSGWSYLKDTPRILSITSKRDQRL